VHEFEFSAGYSNIVLENTTFPRAPWSGCSSSTLAAILTAFLTLVEAGYVADVRRFLAAGARRGFREKALVCVITLLSVCILVTHTF
jgi:hypothetical protein